MISFNHGVFLDSIDAVDPDLLLAWRNNYKIWRYCRQNDLIPKGKHLSWYDGASHHEDTHNRMYSIWTKISGNFAPVGACGLTNIDDMNRNAEFSLYIGPEVQKKGYGEKALKTLISHGFNNLNLEVIWGESFDYNQARNMFKRIGMKEEGCRRHFYFREGQYHDAYLYSMLRSEWETMLEFENGRKQCSI